MSNLDLDEIDQLLKPIELAPVPFKPLVSILTPNFNYANYIGEAIESVLDQTYPHFEMLVCDDGSTDKSCQVVEAFTRRDSRVKLIRKENGGNSSALNAAYRESTGEIICLLDADDRYLPEKLDIVVQAFRSHPHSGFLGHRMFQITADGRRLGVTSMLNDPPHGWYGPAIVRDGDLPPGLPFGSGICFRRALSRRIFPLPEKFRSYADGVIRALATLITPVIGVPTPLSEYRYHGQNISNTASVTVENLDRELSLNRMLWELRKQYLENLDPRLVKVFPAFDRRQGTLISNYVQARLTKRGQGFTTYHNLVRAESFHKFHSIARCFWRFSILLPRPLFRGAVNQVMRPGAVKKLAWRVSQRIPMRVPSTTQ